MGNLAADVILAADMIPSAGGIASQKSNVGFIQDKLNPCQAIDFTGFFGMTQQLYIVGEYDAIQFDTVRYDAMYSNLRYQLPPSSP